MAGLSDISVSNYTQLQWLTSTGTQDWAVASDISTLAEVTSIGELGDEKTIIDVQSYGVDYLRKLTGTANAGPIDFVVNINPDDATHQWMFNLYETGARETFRLTMFDPSLTDGNYVEFTGFVASKSQGNEFDSARTVTFSVAIDGAIGALTEWVAPV